MRRATLAHPDLPAHFEQCLGEIVRGWSDEARMHGIQVVSFDRQPEAGVRTFATLGLSRHVVGLPGSRRIRQELLISANNSFAADAVAGFLLSRAEQVLKRGSALLRGEVLDLGAPVIDGSALASVYVTNPSPFDDSLTRFVGEPPATVFAYLIPVNPAEAGFVRKKGWSWFEDELEQQNPDIWDLARIEGIRGDDGCT